MTNEHGLEFEKENFHRKEYEHYETIRQSLQKQDELEGLLNRAQTVMSSIASDVNDGNDLNFDTLILFNDIHKKITSYFEGKE